MFGFGKRKQTEAAKKLGEGVAQAITEDIDAFMREQVMPLRRAYVSRMVENLTINPTEEVSATDIGAEHYGFMMEAWARDAYPNIQQAGEQFCATYEENGLADIASAVRQRFARELNQQSYELACEGIEAIREALAAHRGEPPLNGRGMDSVRELVKSLGSPGTSPATLNALFDNVG